MRFLAHSCEEYMRFAITVMIRVRMIRENVLKIQKKKRKIKTIYLNWLTIKSCFVLKKVSNVMKKKTSKTIYTVAVLIMTLQTLNDENYTNGGRLNDAVQLTEFRSANVSVRCRSK